jgi:hypothetical protein
LNICDYIIQNDLPHQVLTDGRIAQTTTLYLSGCGITSLDGFVHNEYLDLSHNQISSLEGFTPTHPFFIDIRDNPIFTKKLNTYYIIYDRGKISVIHKRYIIA